MFGIKADVIISTEFLFIIYLFIYLFFFILFCNRFLFLYFFSFSYRSYRKLSNRKQIFVRTRKVDNLMNSLKTILREY